MLTLLCAVFSSAWGQQVAYTFQTAQNRSYSDYTKTYDVVIDGLTWNVPGNHYADGVLRIGGKSLANVDRVITGKSSISDEIISIKVNHSGTTSDKLIVNSFTVTVASDANFTNVIETKTVTPTIEKNVAGNFEITPTSNWPAGSYYKFTINISNSVASNYAWVLNTIEFFKEGNAGPIDPSVTLENTEITVGRTLTISKPSDLTITCTSSNESAATVTNDGVITAIQEGTTTITVNWEASDKYNSGSETFNVTVLPKPAPSVTLEKTEVTVGKTLTITKPSDLTTTCESSNESVATVTDDGVITAIQEGNTEITISWEENSFYASGSQTFNVTVLPKSEAINYIKVTSNNQLVAGNEYLLVSEQPEKYYAMGEAQTTSVRAAVPINLPEDEKLSITDEEVVVVTLGGVKDAWTLTTNDNLGDLCLTSDGNNIHYTANKTNATEAERTWTFTSDFQIQSNSYPERYIQYNYNSGNPRMCCYKNTQKSVYLYVKEGSAVINNPTITIEPTTIPVVAAGGKKTITVNYDNFGDDFTITANVAFYEEDGETAAEQPEWITATINSDNNLAITLQPNTNTADRLAYLKVYAKDKDNNDVFSDLITIEQAAYIADYATIPFEFNGGRADISTTAGLTQEGLDSDYSAENTKLKFNSTGDWIILKLEEHSETALSLSFDIKGNPASGNTLTTGTFSVQVSADGETYTNLATYNELSDTQTETFNLTADVRYIKWIYTTKASGNVGLGNIVVIAPEEIVVSFNKRAEGYSTLYYGTTALNIPEGVKAYTYKVGDDGKTVETEYSSCIPKGSAVVIELVDKSILTSDGYPVTFTTAAGSKEAAHTGNMLYGFDEDGHMTVGPNSEKEYYFYSLSLNEAKEEGSIGFYWNQDDGVAFEMPAHRAYLAVEKETANGVSAFTFDGMGTGINSIFTNGLPADGIYTLTGVRVNSDRLQKGIYIVNGNKVVIK